MTVALLQAGADPKRRNYAGQTPLGLTIRWRDGYGTRAAIGLLEHGPKPSNRLLRQLLCNAVRRASDIPFSERLVHKLLEFEISPRILTTNDFRSMSGWNKRTNNRELTTGFPGRARKVLQLLTQYGGIIPPKLLCEIL